MAVLEIEAFRMLPWTVWPVLALGLFLTTVGFSAAYNLFFHPLRHIPGPKLWACSQFPYTYYWVCGKLGFIVRDFHQVYGDTVRIAPNRVSFTHPDAWNQIRGHRKAGSGQAENGKDPLIFDIIRPTSILGADRDDHSRIRRTLANGFSAKAMQAQEGLIAGYVDLLFSKLKTLGPTNGGVVDLSAWLNFFAFDLIADLAFGESSYNCLANGEYHPWVLAILSAQQQFALLAAVVWHFGRKGFDVVKWASSWLSGSSRLAQDQQTQYALAQVRKRVEEGPDGNRDEKRKQSDRDKVIDFIGSMTMPSRSGQREMSETEIAANSRLLVMAGSETVTTALGCAVYFLAIMPRVQKRLAEEIRGQFSREEDITMLSVNNLKYMLAVLDESMRIMPPVPGNQPRVVGTKGGDTICGWYLPEGTALDIWTWAANHLERNFTRAKDFIPERWLDVDEFEGVRFNKERHGASQPFSVGPRNCIGKNLAYVEMRMILARLVWNFDLELSGEESKKFLDCKSYSTWVKRQLHVKLTPVARG
ncbi:cytochrome P450 [Cladorrhinum sp. PSN259]|nr:cytochrome P450 [Cladorrhinum sp. PSN259]